MLGRIATDEQAAAMVKNWLLSKDHFCISEKGDSSGNDDVCWHGLPSIARSDPAYATNGYWRGLVWVCTDFALDSVNDPDSLLS
eukprot:SAG11_NODE_2758_length_3005_cov_1.315554_2_plen_84_part_00